jgi:hypothetical protein
LAGDLIADLIEINARQHRQAWTFQVHWVNPLNGKLRAEEQRVPHDLQ